MDYDQEIERMYHPENFEPFDEETAEAIEALEERQAQEMVINSYDAGKTLAQANKEIAVLARTQIERLVNADLCQPGSFGEMCRKYATIEDMEALCA
jgi:hypothetical protein